MDRLRIALKFIVQWVMLLMIGFVGWVEAGGAMLYQQALVAEKNVGDLKGALQLYEQILVDIKGEDAWMVNRVRDRVVALRERLGLPKRVDTQKPRRGIVSVQQMFFPRNQVRREPSPYVLAIDRQFSDLKSQLGVDRFAEDRVEDLESLSWIETQFHNTRRALGIQSFSEKIVVAATRRRQSRPMSFVELFQAGLNAEKGAGDFEAAIGYYQRALDRVPETAFGVQINKRLVFCQQHVQP